MRRVPWVTLAILIVGGCGSSSGTAGADAGAMGGSGGGGGSAGGANDVLAGTQWENAGARCSLLLTFSRAANYSLIDACLMTDGRLLIVAGFRDPPPLCRCTPGTLLAIAAVSR